MRFFGRKHWMSAPLRDGWFEVSADDIQLASAGIYEWRIEGVGIYIGQSKRLAGRLREYPNNVRKIIDGAPYRKGKPGEARRTLQRSRGFVKLVKWRTGSEARISCLKRDYGWRRTRNDSITGATTWCAWGVLAHNATKIVAMLDDRADPTRTDASGRRPATRSTSPPGRRRTPTHP